MGIGKQKGKCEFLDQILIILGHAYPCSLAFEEMAEMFCGPGSGASLSGSSIESEARVMDALLELETLGLVCIDSNSDESSLTVLGSERIAGKRYFLRLV